MRTVRLTLALLLFVACVGTLAAPPAAAQNPEDEAFSLYQKARADFEQGNFKEALEKLTRAYKLFPQPVILLKKAEAHENLGQIEEAHAAYSALRDRKFKKNRKQALRRLDALLAKPVNISILTGQVTGAQIFLDGVDTGSLTPAVIEVTRGKHTLRIVKEGYPPYERNDFVAKGLDTVVLQIPLKALTGTVRVRLESGSYESTRVRIDGKPVPVPDPAATTSRALELTTGDHELVCERTGAPRHFSTFSLEADEERLLLCKFPTAEVVEDGGGSVVPAVITLVAGAAAAGVGTWLLISYFDDQEHADRNNLKLESSKQIVGPALIGVGVAAMVGSIFLWPSSSDSSARAERLPDFQIGVAPFQGGGAVTAVGRF